MLFVKLESNSLKQNYITEHIKNLFQMNHEIIDTYAVYNRSIVIKFKTF